MKTRNNQKGFSAVEIVIVIVVVGLLGAVGWYVWQNRKSETQNSQNNTTQNNNGMKTYTDKFGNFSISYPSSWKVKTEDGTNYPTENGKYIRTTLTSPTNSVLNLVSNWGGKGGDCQPAKNDSPFKSGNSCNSKEYLSSEIMPVNNIYSTVQHLDTTGHGNVTSTIDPVKVMLVTEHHLDTKGKTTYSISLADSTAEYPIVVSKPEMGYLSATSFITVQNSKGELRPYIYAYASSSDKSILSGADAATIKSILRTFKYNGE